MNAKLGLALLSLTCALFAPRADAAPIISIVPSSVTVNVGDPVELDLVVSGLGAGEAVGAVSVRLTGDGTLLDAVGFTLDPDDRMGGEIDFGSGFGTNTLDLVFAAEDFAPADQFDTLKALQGTGFVLAHISLLAIAPGISPISIVDEFGGFLSNADGSALVGTGTRNGLVCIGEEFAQRCEPSVPEPGLMALMVAGLAAAAVRRRASKRS
jgi:hypothetical protein